MIEKTCNQLANAFGGHSQYTPAIVGKAIAGKKNNGGHVYTLITDTEYRVAFATWYQQRWEDGLYEEEELIDEFLLGLNGKDLPLAGDVYTEVEIPYVKGRRTLKEKRTSSRFRRR